MDGMIALQVLAFFSPIALTLIVWGCGLFSGHKTTINSGFVTVVAGLGAIDLSFLPDEITAALLPGFAISTLLSNTILTNREQSSSTS